MYNRDVRNKHFSQLEGKKRVLIQNVPSLNVSKRKTPKEGKQES